MAEFDNDKLFFVGQKAFIEKDGEVLVVFDPILGLDFPGGKLKEDELDLCESLQREVFEETGLNIEIGEPFHTWHAKVYNHELKKRGDIIYLVGYRCKYKGGEVKISNEHSSFKWVNKDNYQEFKSDNKFFEALDKYFKRA